MIRIGGRELDEDDNLRMAFKWVKDEISECLIPSWRKVYVTPQGQVREIKGRADSDKRISWQYAQEKGKKLGIRIEITPASTESHPGNIATPSFDPSKEPAHS
jgi:hypothetical protein